MLLHNVHLLGNCNLNIRLDNILGIEQSRSVSKRKKTPLKVEALYLWNFLTGINLIRSEGKR